MATPTEAQGATDAAKLAQQNDDNNNAPAADTGQPTTLLGQANLAFATSGNWAGLNYSAGKPVPPNYILTAEDEKVISLSAFDALAKQHDKDYSDAEKQFQKDLLDPDVNSFQRDANYLAATIAADDTFVDAAEHVDPEYNEIATYYFTVHALSTEVTEPKRKAEKKSNDELAYGVHSDANYQAYLNGTLPEMDWAYFNEGEDQYSQPQVDLQNANRKHSGLPPATPIYAGPPPSPTDPSKVTDIDPYAPYLNTGSLTPNTPPAPAPPQSVDIWGGIPDPSSDNNTTGNPAPPSMPSAPPASPAVDIWGSIPDLSDFEVGSKPSAAPAPPSNPLSAGSGVPGGSNENAADDSGLISSVSNAADGDFGDIGGYNGTGFNAFGNTGGSGGGQAESSAEAGMDAAQGGPADSGAQSDANSDTADTADVDMGDFAEPVILDLNSDGIDIVPLGKSNVAFDILGDGQMQLMAWVGPDDALLVYDRDGDRLISHRDEIAFVDYMDNAETDLEGLAWFDQLEQGGNQDGVLNALDVLWSRFGVWRDANQDGVTDPGELRMTGEGGLASVNLASDRRVRWGGQDFRIFGRGSYEMTDADGRTSSGDLYDAALRHKRKPGEKTPASRLHRPPG